LMAAASPARCPWVPADKLDYVAYHDREWGRAPPGDAGHFELLCLEGAQAGLSWYTVLRKRDGYRAAFHGFDPAKCARMTDVYIDRVVRGECGDVVKHRGKVASVRANAAAFLRVVEEFGSWQKFIAEFLDGAALDDVRVVTADVPSVTGASEKLAAELKLRGMKFVGATTIYAYMQAAGIVNDHLASCFCFEACRDARRARGGGTEATST
jgi:DNA-3-methyladenine glycosylase I